MAKRKKTMNLPAANQAPVEWKRTPVCPELAAAIRRMDGLLQSEFNLDIAYCVMARDGVVAASGAVHGYLPPVAAQEPPASGTDRPLVVPAPCRDRPHPHPNTGVTSRCHSQMT